MVEELLVSGEINSLKIAIGFAESGKELWQLYKDVCDEDLGQTIRVLRRVETQRISPWKVRAALATGDAQSFLKGSDATTNERRTYHEGQPVQRGTASSWSKRQRHWPLRNLTWKNLRGLLRNIIG